VFSAEVLSAQILTAANLARVGLTGEQGAQPVSLVPILARGNPACRDDVCQILLSRRNVEDLLAERGIDMSYETARFWCNRFGPMFAADN
jgi:hypothetical protein